MLEPISVSGRASKRDKLSPKIAALLLLGIVAIISAQASSATYRDVLSQHITVVSRAACATLAVASRDSKQNPLKCDPKKPNGSKKSRVSVAASVAKPSPKPCARFTDPALRWTEVVQKAWDSSFKCLTHDDHQMLILGVVDLLYCFAYILSLVAVWISIRKRAFLIWPPRLIKRLGVDKRRFGSIISSGAISFGTLASILWVGLDSNAPAEVKGPTLGLVLGVIGGGSVILALFIDDDDINDDDEASRYERELDRGLCN